jgi:hypothetical protein
MAHFAKVLDGKVLNVIVAEPEFFETFIDTAPGDWIQTSYNTRGGIHYQPNSNEPSEDQSKALRKNYAVVGGIYDKRLDAFMPAKPYPSWILNEETCLWEAPIPKPDDGLGYGWDEENQIWEQVTESE